MKLLLVVALAMAVSASASKITTEQATYIVANTPVEKAAEAVVDLGEKRGASASSSRMTEEEAWAIVDSLPAVEDAASAVLNLENVASQYDLSAAELLAHSDRDLWGSRPTKRALLAKRGGARGLSEIRDVLGNAAFTHTQSQLFPGSVHHRRRLSWTVSSLVKAAVTYGGSIVKAVVAAVPKVTGLGGCSLKNCRLCLESPFLN